MLLDHGIIKFDEFHRDPKVFEYSLPIIIGYACQQGNIALVQALVQHGVALNEVALYTPQAVPPPITIAMAFRQDRMVQVLRELGATEVDPIDTIFGDGFAAGKFPCDPPPPPECRMLWRCEGN